MPLAQQFEQLCRKLIDRGWRPVLLDHGLDLRAANLERQMDKALEIDRDKPGFEDFAGDGERGIEPGRPARSLLYHALACPGVQPRPNGRRARETDYPTLAELDLVENYIYSRAKWRLADFTNPVVAVFAYQYRRVDRTHHLRHADLCFSRTGVARVGTAPAAYVRSRRGFWIDPRADGIPVLPARYGAFIAEADDGRDTLRLQRPLPGASLESTGPGRLAAIDADHRFLFPRHKLFSGDECLVGETLDLEFHERHINEKLARIYEFDRADNPGALRESRFRTAEPPFVRESGRHAQGELVELDEVGASRLVVPRSAERLVRFVKQGNRFVTFDVPPRRRIGEDANRFNDASMLLPAGRFGRAAPEYLHIRWREGQQPADLNELPDARYRDTLRDGGYAARHITDDTCDGVVACRARGLPLRSLPAYSLVTAVDFLPNVEQIELQRWSERNPQRSRAIFKRDQTPRPLSYSRYGLSERQTSPNARLADALRQPGGARLLAFSARDPLNWTATSIVGDAPGTAAGVDLESDKASASFLPDGAADIFAPGWDVSMHGDASGFWFGSYGLGSPFPEDAMLCAALSTYWPAAAPDTARTFADVGSGFQTATPMLDDELGYHRSHPRVRAGEVEAAAGWDGEHGPFFEGERARVNFARGSRADYTVAALQGRLRIGRLAGIDAREIVARMEALIDALAAFRGGKPSSTEWLLVVAERVADWVNVEGLSGGGYLYEFARVDVDDAEVDARDLKRARVDVDEVVVCQVSATHVRWRRGAGRAKLVERGGG